MRDLVDIAGSEAESWCGTKGESPAASNGYPAPSAMSRAKDFLKHWSPPVGIREASVEYCIIRDLVSEYEKVPDTLDLANWAEQLYKKNGFNLLSKKDKSTIKALVERSMRSSQ